MELLSVLLPTGLPNKQDVFMPHREKITVPNPVIDAAQLVIAIHTETLAMIDAGKTYVLDGEDITELVRSNALAGIEHSKELLVLAPRRLTQDEVLAIQNYTPQQKDGLRTPRPARPTHG